ncbi:MAG: Flp pilus assembly protein CpaB [Acidobacteria bacterium]|nr:Flp pilus assembly protein CpaB [Acidobacteriota bacterium]
MKRNLMPLLAVAFVAAVVATGIFYGLLIPKLRNTASADNAGAIVVAARAVDRGATLRPEDLRLAEPGAQRPAQALTSLDQAAGATVLEPLAANQPLTLPLIVRRGASGPSLAIPNGRRAVSIHPMESSGVVAMLRSGSRVDIQVIDTKQAAKLSRLMEDVEVLSVMDADRARPVVTLLVKPEDADRLSLADALQQVRVVARNPNDRVGGNRS